MAAATAGGSFAQPGPYGTPPVPPRVPVRLHWSNHLALFGGLAMAVALVLVLAGVPARLLYDADGPGKLTEPTANPASLTTSIDQNMKYLVDATGYEKGQYNYFLNNVNKSEEGLPAMAERLEAMNATVAEMDSSLGRVLVITQAMTADMQAMSAGAGRSAKTMQQLEADIGTLTGTMAEMYLSTQALVDAMARIEAKAKGIGGQTGKARDLTRELSGALPNEVPTPQTSLDPDPVAVPQ
jgi:hypothetical protein